MRKLLLISLVIIIAIALILIGCGESTSTTTTVTTPAVTNTAPAPTSEPEESKYGGILKLVPYAAPTTPLGYPPESAEYTITCPCVQSLLRVTDKPEPRLATSWDIADDGSSMTIYLRQGVKFHDGTDFNATAAKWNLDEGIKMGKVPQFESVDIINDYTIRINLSSWSNTILNNMEEGTQMISPTAFQENGIEWARWHPVSTGPFKFVEYQRDVKIVYERNSDYWEEGKPYLDGIEYYVIPDKTAQLLAFQNKDIYALRSDGKTAQDLMSAGYPYQKLAGGTYALYPDSANPSSPFTDKNVRIAISHAIDRETLAKTLGYGLLSPAYQLYPGFESAAIPNLDIDNDKYDVNEAKRLLANAGYEKGFSVTIYNFQIIPEDVINAVANMLGQVGITVKIETPEFGLYVDIANNGWSNGMMAQALASSTNLNEWLKVFLGGTPPLSFSSLERPSGLMDALNASLAAKSIDPEKIQAIIKIIHDDETVIPFVEEVAIIFFQKGVHDTAMLDYSLDRTWTPENAWLDANLR